MTERWVKMVEKFAERERYCIGSDILYREDVVKLLARQHRAMVRMVKKEATESINLIISHPFAVDVTEDTQPDETKRETMAHTRKETQVMTVEMDETNGGRHSKVGMNFMAIGSEALARMALVLEQGAVAHNDPDGTNWRKIPCEVHLNHLLYHVNAWMRGVVGEDHLGHALCRAMMACETEGGGQWRS